MTPAPAWRAAAPAPATQPEWVVSGGLPPSPEALAAMEARAAAIRAGEAGELVWLVEHAPTYTAGTSATPQGLVDPRFPVFRAGRGGPGTHHGPGPRTPYVVLGLQRRRPGLGALVHALEGGAK